MTIFWWMYPEIWSATDNFLSFSTIFTNINDSHMVHGSSDMECNRRNFCHFRLLFALLPPNSPKNQNLKKMKKHLEISSVYTSVPKIMIICYTVPYIWHVTDLIVFFILGYFLPFYLSSSPKNHDHMLYWSWGMVHDGCNYFSFWVIFCPFTLLTAP